MVLVAVFVGASSSNSSDSKVIFVILLVTLLSSVVSIYFPSWIFFDGDTVNSSRSPINLIHFLLSLQYFWFYFVRHRHMVLVSSGGNTNRKEVNPKLESLKVFDLAFNH